MHDVYGVGGGHFVPAVWSSDSLLRVQCAHEEVLFLSRTDLKQTGPPNRRYVIFVSRESLCAYSSSVFAVFFVSDGMVYVRVNETAEISMTICHQQ